MTANIKGLPPALAAHLAGPVTTVCFCWTVVRRDGVVLGFTDHDRPLVLDGITHRPGTGFTAAEAETALGLAIGTDGVEGALAADEIGADDLSAGLWDGATVRTSLVNWADPAQSALLRTAAIARIEQADGAWRAELEDISSAFAVPRGRVISKRCDAELGDGRCRAVLTAPGLTLSGTVAALEGRDALVVAGLGAAPDGWFDGGRFKAGSDTVTVLRHRRAGATALLDLDAPVPPGVTVGTAFTITAGCDKRFQTCRDKFANSVNFRGFPHLPGTDAAYRYAHDGMAADGGPVVP